MPLKKSRGDSFDGRYATLRSGDKMPIVGLGTWKSKPGEVAAALKTAIDAGYRHIDCARIYCNEKEIGDALKEIFASGKVKREDLFITSKLWNTFHDAQDVLPALQKTLDDLQLSYLDLYLMHYPYGFQRGDSLEPKHPDGTIRFSDTHYLVTWAEMEKAADQGLARNIGLSNFNSRQMEEVCEKGRVRPAVNQCECHPYLTQIPLLASCEKLGVVFTAYSPLGSGDRPWAKPGDPKLIEDEGVKAVADKYGKSSAQVLIRFQLERGVVVIPKSVTPQRIQANLDVFDFELSEADMEKLASFNRPWRSGEPTITNAAGEVIRRDAAHPFYPFNEPF